MDGSSAILMSILRGVFVLVALIMTIFILLQEGKGGGLAALGGTRAAGVEGVTNPIRRATAYLSAIFFILAIVLGRLGQAPPSQTTKDLYKKDAAAEKAEIAPPEVPAAAVPAMKPAVVPDTPKAEGGAAAPPALKPDETGAKATAPEEKKNEAAPAPELKVEGAKSPEPKAAEAGKK